MTQNHPTLLDPSFRGLIGVARRDITPPVGIYARNWAAATHDVATAIHRPLTLTCITFQIDEDSPPLVLIGADLMSWRSRDDEWFVRGGVLGALSLDESRLMFCLSHTHAAPSLRSEDESKPGGELIAAYRTHVRDAAIDAAREAIAKRHAATLAWRYGKCDLATNRDFPARDGGLSVSCGFNPYAAADDTLLVGRVTTEAGHLLGTIVNYACHPTTLAWENSQISPDYVGAMRDVLERRTIQRPCLFLQGASGELAPAQQYTADTTIADRHGARLGHAALSTLAGMCAPGRRLTFDRVVQSGAPLAVWAERDASVSTALAAVMRDVELPLKLMPSIDELDAQVRSCNDPVQRERLIRRRAIRRVVGDGATSRQRLWVWRLGDALLVGQPNEAYSIFQQRLRAKFAGGAVAVMNLVNGSAGYLPPREMYAKDVYQVTQTPFAEGSLEALMRDAETALSSLT